MRKALILCLFVIPMILNSNTYAQWPIGSNATVLSGFQFGPNHFYYLNNSFGVLFKTAAIPEPLLNIGQTVFLMPTVDEGYFIIPGVSTNYQVAAYEIEASSNIDPILPVFPSGEMPTFWEEYNMLIFNDSVHFEAVYDYIEKLDSLYDSTLDIDNILNAFLHQYPNYLSYYGLFESIYHESYEYFESDFDDILNNWFISDDIERAFVNDFRLVCIGKRVYLIFNDEIIISVDSRDREGINTLINLSKNPEYYANLIGDEKFEIVGSNEHVTLKKSLNSDLLRRKYFNSVAFDETPKKCSDVGFIRLKLYYVNNNVLFPFTHESDFNEFTDVTLIVDWGDGNIQTIVGYSGQGLYHQYPVSYGEYVNYYPKTHIIATVNNGEEVLEWLDGEGTEGVPIKFWIRSGCGINFFNKRPEIFISENEKYKILAHQWHKTNGRVGTSITHYQKSGNSSSYVKRGATLSVNINATRFNSNNCTYDKNKNNPKVLKKRKYKLRTSKKFSFIRPKSYWTSNNPDYEDYRSWSYMNNNKSSGDRVEVKWYFPECNY